MTKLTIEAADFIRAIEVEQNCSEHTIRSYTYMLSRYCQWLCEHDFTVFDVDMRAYILFLKTTLKGKSIKCHIACLKAFYKYLNTSFNPEFPKRVKIDKYDVTTLSKEQVQTLLDAVEKRADSIHHDLSLTPNDKRLLKQADNCKRDLSIIAMLVGTGIRVGELAQIDISDIDFEGKSIIIHGKGNRLRRVFFDIPVIEDALLKHLEIRMAVPTDSQALFLNSKDFTRITTRSVQRMLKTYLKLADLPLSTSPHILRHTYATISIENGANIKAICKLLGHANVKTTLEYYAHLSANYLHKVFKACCPFVPSDITIQNSMQNRMSIVTET